VRKQTQDKKSSFSKDSRFQKKPIDPKKHHTENQSERNSDFHKERNSDFHKERNSDFHKERNSDFHKERNSDFHKERNSDFHKERNSDFKKERYSDFLKNRNHDYITERNSDFYKEDKSDTPENKPSYRPRELSSDYRRERHSESAENCIYGIHAVEELLKTRLTSIDHIYFSKETSNQELFNLMKQCRKERLAYNLVPEMKIDQISQSSKHQGVAAICSVKDYCSAEELKNKVLDKSDSLLLLPASVEDPGNLGAMIRSSVAFNVDAMILERKNTAPLNSSVAKSAAGMIEHVTIARPKNIEALIEEFKGKGFSIIGADAARGVAPDQIDMTGPTLLILGGEHRGIPPYLEKACTAFVSIPISSTVQSLNVSAAAAILLYECNRQRLTKASSGN